MTTESTSRSSVAWSLGLSRLAVPLLIAQLTPGLGCKADGKSTGGEGTRSSSGDGGGHSTSDDSGSGSTTAEDSGSSTTGTDTGTGTGTGTDRSLDPQAVYYRVDAPQVVAGPSFDTDTVFNTLQTDEGLFAYTANATTSAWFGSTLDDLSLLSDAALEPGDAGSFDECGAWLNGARVEGDQIYGWYHAEEACVPPDTHKSVAYVESSDGGRTFQKVGYPDNRVITADASFDGDASHDDAGDPCFVDFDGYHHAYFGASSDWKIHVARAAVGAPGPGEWNKYFEGAFSEPGLGGRSSAVTGLVGYIWVSVDDVYDHQLMGITLSNDSWSLGLAFSTDGLSFTGLPTAVIPLEDQNWSRTADAHELVAYPSALGLDGDSQHVGDSFWLYYSYLLPGDDFDQRYLLRRQLTRVDVDPKSEVGPASRQALIRTRSDSLEDDRVTTVQLDQRYHLKEIMGYLLSEATDDATGSIEVTGCYIADSGDHVVSVSGICDGATYVRRLGYALTAEGPERVAVYRCYDSAADNHFLSTDAGCEGTTTEWQLGYLLSE